MRRVLDTLYLASGFVGALMLMAMLFMIIVQMFARWLEFPVTGLTEIAGYCMAATSFFGLGYAFSKNSHIRVSLIIGQKEPGERLPEIVCSLVATVIALALAYFAIRTTVFSFQFNEISQGQDAIPTWIPQIAMSIGSVILVVALLDRLIGIILGSGSAKSAESVAPRGQ